MVQIFGRQLGRIALGDDIYDRIMLDSDVKSRGWLLVGDPSLMLIIVIAYILLSVALTYRNPLPRPLNVKPVLKAYNFFMIFFNLYMVYEFVAVAVIGQFSWLCQPADFEDEDPSSVRLASVIWCYYISKFIELLDTAFFVLAHKYSHVSFLHVYHHSSMVVFIWSIATFACSGDSFFPILCNCVIHVIMYLYYFLASFGPALAKYLWWKRHLTKMQLIQFITIIIHSFVAIYINCTPNKWQWFLIVYEFSFVVLFSNFYIQAYRNKKSQKSERPQKSD